MKKSVKIVLFLVVILLILVVGGYLIIWKMALTDDDEEKLTTVEQDIALLTETFPTCFFIFGDKLEFDEKISVSYIDNISEANLSTDLSNFNQLVIIVNDLNGQVELSDNEWLLIKKMIDDNVNYSFFYLGKREIERLQNLEVIKRLSLLTEDDLSVGIVRQNGRKIYISGTYTVQDEQSKISEYIMHELAYSLRLSTE